MERKFTMPPPTEIQVLSAGTFFRPDPLTGQPVEMTVTDADLQQMVLNFEAGVYNQTPPLTVNHDDKEGALAHIRGLRAENGRLFATELDWTERGVRIWEEGAFPYISAEWFDEWTHFRTGAKHEKVFVGATMTVRPFLKEDVLPRAAEEEVQSSPLRRGEAVRMPQTKEKPTMAEEATAQAVETPPEEPKSEPTPTLFTEQQMTALVEARLAEEREKLEERIQAIEREKEEMKRAAALTQFSENLRSIRPGDGQRLAPATIQKFEDVAKEHAEIPHGVLLALAESANVIPVGEKSVATESTTTTPDTTREQIRTRAHELLSENPNLQAADAFLRATKEITDPEQRKRAFFEVPGEEVK